MNELGPLRRVSSFAWAAGAYLATGLIGVWAGYDPQVAWARLALICAGFGLAIGVGQAVGRWGRSAELLLGLCATLGAASVGIYFSLAWLDVTGSQAGPGAGLLVKSWTAVRPLFETMPALHENAAGGALVVLIPLGVGGLLLAKADRAWLVALISGTGLLIALAALALTGSRGSWGALVASGLLVGWLVVPPRTSIPRFPLRRPLFQGLLVVVVLGGALAVAASFVNGWRNASGLISELVGPSGPSRLALWRDLLALVQDCFFTGCGHGSLTWAYSSYALLVQVPYFGHAHNLFLQILLEQGVGGLAAFIAMAGFGLRAVARVGPTGTRQKPMRAAAMAALVTVLLHGLVDAELYASGLVPVMFLPFGVALGSEVRRGARLCRSDPRSLRATGRLGVFAAFTLLLVGVAALPATRAAFLANLGAVSQTRAELAAYTRGVWPVQDAVRRSPAVDLSPSIRLYQQALGLDSANVTANRRLGQIELSRGEYGQARHHLEQAYRAAPHQRPARQLLGESYAIDGQVELAARLWRTVDVGQGQLRLRRHWYEALGDRQRAAWILQAAALSVSPSLRR